MTIENIAKVWKLRVANRCKADIRYSSAVAYKLFIRSCKSHSEELILKMLTEANQARQFSLHLNERMALIIKIQRRARLQRRLYADLKCDIAERLDQAL